MEFLLEIVAEFVLELLGEMLLEVGLESFKEASGRPNRNPIVAVLGYMILGAGIGAASLWFLPGRVLKPGPIPGISVLLSPLIGGAVMQMWGSFRRAHGHTTTNLATFYGGGALLLSYSLARLVWAR